MTTQTDQDKSGAGIDNLPVHIRFPHLVQNPPRKFEPEALFMAGAPAPQKASTLDWDTVYAIKFPDVNLALAKPGVTPTAFNATDPASGATITGNFSPWQLTGGAGILLHLSTPIPTGTMTYLGTDYPMDGAVAILEVELKDLPQPPTANGTPVQVVANAQKVVSVTDLTVPSNPPLLEKGIMRALLEQWFNANLQDFTHAFATVNLNETADQDQFQWMKPTALGWAVSAQATPAENVFGVLSMTENRNKPAVMGISPNAIPAGQRAGFLIAQDRFLAKLLLPGFHTIFDGAKDGDFEVIDAGTVITNKNTVRMDTVKIGAGTYQPELPPGHVRLTLEAAEIRMELIKAHVPFSPGIDIYMSYTGFSAIALEPNSKGEQVLLYKEASPPVTDHHVEQAAWVTGTEIAASIVAAVATFGSGVYFKKVIEKITYRVIATIIVLIVSGVVANIAAIIKAVAEGDKDKIPPVKLMVKNATDPVIWPDGKDFLLTSAGLNESLQLGGDPQIT